MRKHKLHINERTGDQCDKIYVPIKAHKLVKFIGRVMTAATDKSYLRSSLIWNVKTHKPYVNALLARAMYVEEKVVT